MDFTEINSRRKRGELLGRIDRKNSRFRTAKTTIIKFGLHASFVELESAKSALNKIVRAHYFVRGGFFRHRSSASSKHLSSHLPVELDSSGVKKGLRCTCKLHVWVSGLQRNRPDVDVWRSDVTALALSYRTFPLRKV
ncbi:hypothetical protein TNCV_764221 [Trichonephila clavipes]|nr:hypothetical protein TNCV_764221 [Trichonephila clavipes]